MRRGATGIVITAITVAGLGLTGGLFLPAQTPVVVSPPVAVVAPVPSVAAASMPTAASSAPAAMVASATAPEAQDAGCVIVSLKRSPTAEERARLGLTASSIIHGDRLVVATAPEGLSASEFAAQLARSDLVAYAEPDYLVVPAAAPYSSYPNDTYFRDEGAWGFPESDGTHSNIPHAKSWSLRGEGSANFDQVWPALAGDKAGPARAQDVRVAVIDTGFYFEGWLDPSEADNVHAAIDECATYTPSTSRSTTDTDVTPVSAAVTGTSSAHGTMVASEIGQRTSNFSGSAGAAWDTRVDVYKIQGIAGATYGTVRKGDVVMPDSALVKAIYDAVDDAHAKGYRLVINVSLVERSGSTGSTSVRNAIAYARRPDHDAIVVAAAGNDDNSVVSYPAAYDGVIAVGAYAVNMPLVGALLATRSSFSNYGTKLDVLAPGSHIWGPIMPVALMDTGSPDAGYGWWDGTSMAAPYVSSAAALLLRIEPSLTAAEVETYLTHGAVDMGAPGRDNSTGWGRLDVRAAYLALATPRTTLEPRLAYADGSMITLSVADRDSGDSVTTYYRLDGDEGEGRTILVNRRSGDLHVLEYWSVDSNGATEATHESRFYVLAPDLLAPSTSGDVTRTYAGQAAIHLGAQDPEPGWPTAEFPIATYYRLDSGHDTTGTAITVGSRGIHTLRYWSVDYAGNVEAPTVATFTVTLLPARVTIARNTSAIRSGGHIHLSGKLAPARAGDTVTIQVKTPGSHVWKDFTGLTKYYRRSVGNIGPSGSGTWSTLTYTLRTRGRYYFRAVYSGDTKGLSRASSTSGTVTVLVK